MRKIEGLWKKLFPGRDRDLSRDRKGAGKLEPLPDGRGSEDGRGSIDRILHGWCSVVAAKLRHFIDGSRTYVLPGDRKPVRPGVLIVCTVFLVCLCAILLTWSRRPRSDIADFDLRADNSSSNLDNTSAERPANPLDPPPQPKVPEDQPEKSVEESRPLAVPPPAPVVQVSQTEGAGMALPPPPATVSTQPPDLPPPPVPMPEPLRLSDAAPVNLVPTLAAEPDAFDSPIDWHRGDVPMIRNWHKTLGYQAILAAAMFATPVTADDSDGKKNATDASKAIKEQLDRIEKKVESLDALKRDIDGLRREVELLNQSNISDFGKVNKRVTDMEEKLKNLETRLSQAATRIANSPPAPAIPTTGRVRLLNNFPSPARVILNNTVYRLNPSESREVDVPLGAYTFEVLIDGFGSVQPLTTGTLAANTPRTIEIFAR